MRIAVLGAGAVGGFFGAKLAVASNNVAFIARGAHLAVLAREGLFIESFQGNLHIRDALFTDAPAAVGPVDLILFCVKSYDTESAAQALAPMMDKETVVLSLQNGVDNADKIARRWGAQRTLAGVVYLGSQLWQPGRIKHSAGGRIVFGELDGQIHESTRAIERVLASAQVTLERSFLRHQLYDTCDDGGNRRIRFAGQTGARLHDRSLGSGKKPKRRSGSRAV